jgi:hypothetical protein
MNSIVKNDNTLRTMWTYFVKSQVAKSKAPQQPTKHTLNATWFHGIASTVYEMKGMEYGLLGLDEYKDNRIL